MWAARFHGRAARSHEPQTCPSSSCTGEPPTFGARSTNQGRGLMKRRSLILALAAALGALVAAPAHPQSATPAGGKAKLAPAAGSAAAASVTVTNSRKADLVQLQAAESGSASWKKVLGALKSGAHASAQLPRPFNCRIDLHGTFANGESMDAAGVDVCQQK